MKGSAKIWASGHKFYVDFDYSEDKNWNLTHCDITEVTMSNGNNERRIKNFSKIEEELKEAIKDVHYCACVDEESDCGEWLHPDVGDDYQEYYDRCEAAYCDEAMERYLIEN